MAREETKREMREYFEKFKEFGKVCLDKIEAGENPSWRAQSYQDMSYCRIFSELNRREVRIIGESLESVCPYLADVDVVPEFDSQACDRRPFCSWPVKFL